MNPLQAAGLWLRCNRTRSFLFIVFLTKHQLEVCSLPPRWVQTNRGSSSVFYETFQSHLYESGPDMSAGWGSVRGWVGSLLRREHETSSRIPARLLLLNKTPRNLLSPFNSTLTPPLRSLINNSTRLEPKKSSEGRNALAESLQSASYMVVLVVVVVVPVMKAATAHLCCKKSL